jgi:hypothetical protein
MHAHTQDHALRVVAKLPEDEVPDGDAASPIKAVVIKEVHEGTRLLSTRVTIMAWHGRESRLSPSRLPDGRVSGEHVSCDSCEMARTCDVGVRIS